jgi:hypothetical protein
LINQAVAHRGNQGPKRAKRLSLVLQTSGGYIETAERIAKYTAEALFLDRIFGAQFCNVCCTVLSMAGDEIWTTYFSTLGPISVAGEA